MTSPKPFKPNLRSKVVAAIASKPYPALFFSRVLHLLDKPLMRWSKGRYAVTSLLTSMPVLTLTTTGAKSGLPRTMPLFGYVEKDRVVIVASNFGQYHNPAWYHNLKANPEAQIVFHGQQHSCVAYEAEGEERAVYWEKMVYIYAGYEAYKKRASHRRIPVMILDIKKS